MFSLFFFNDTATTEIYTLSLHDALPIWLVRLSFVQRFVQRHRRKFHLSRAALDRSEEHTSELQSPCNLVCRLLLEKKNQRAPHHTVRHVVPRMSRNPRPDYPDLRASYRL